MQKSFEPAKNSCLTQNGWKEIEEELKSECEAKRWEV